MMMGVINASSPRRLDDPKSQGLIALAEHGQVAIVTPVSLAGAMAPVSLAGALAMCGGFTSNVDMRTGAPAFGTPEYAKAAQASGQPARRIGVPFRSSNTTAAHAGDALASCGAIMSLWGCLLGARVRQSLARGGCTAG